jgi:RNA polymerase sigma-70 factor (ECF subfamily)
MTNLKSLTDESLVELYALGDNSAFDVLLSRYQKSVHSYIYYIVRNEDLTEDIFQDTFLKVITTIKQGRYTENGKFKAWIMRIAHNLIIDTFRQERNENTISNDEVEGDLFNDRTMSDTNIEDEMIREQVYDDVRKLVRHLPDNQREVLEMRYYQDMSFKEIADVTGVSINTALGRMRYAIINMRRMVDDHHIELTLYTNRSPNPSSPNPSSPNPSSPNPSSPNPCSGFKPCKWLKFASSQKQNRWQGLKPLQGL